MLKLKRLEWGAMVLLRLFSIVLFLGFIAIPFAEGQGFLVQEEFSTYGTGNLVQASQNIWTRIIGNYDVPIDDVKLSVEGRWSSGFSVDFTGTFQTHQYNPLLASPIEIQPGIPFYFGCYFQVSDIPEGERIRAIVRIDDDAPGDQWIRLQARKTGGQLRSVLSLTGFSADHGSQNITANETFQLVIKGIWDGTSTISYAYALNPEIDEDQTSWIMAGTNQTVSGVPKISQLLIGSSSVLNVGRISAVRLGTQYQDMVISESIVNEPPSIGLQTFSVMEGTTNGVLVGSIAANDDRGITQYLIKNAKILKSGSLYPNDAEIDPIGIFSLNATTGNISVNDSKFLLAVIGPIELTVQVSDAQGLTDEALVTINVIDYTVTPSEFFVTEWKSAALAPFGMSEAQSVVLGDKWYVFSGYDANKFLQSGAFTPTNRAYVYDFKDDTWTPISAMPIMYSGVSKGGVTHSGFTTDGVDIYFAGGFTPDFSGNGQLFGTIYTYKYTVAEDRYERLPNFPGARASGELEHINGKLYYVGGTNFSRNLDQSDLFMLDLANLQVGWVKKAPMPNPRSHIGSSVFNNKLYVIGGQHGHDENSVIQDDVHVYDPTADTWKWVTDLPDVEEVASGTRPGRSHISGSTISFGSKIYVVAGEYRHGGPYAKSLVAYEPSTNTWSQYSDLPFNISSGVAGIYDGTIYYCSGLFRNENIKALLPAAKPSILGSNPSNEQNNVELDINIIVNNIFFPEIENNGLDLNTLDTANIKLFLLGEFDNEIIEEVSGEIGNVSGGGDTFAFIPVESLRPTSRYKFIVTDRVKLQNGLTFIPYEVIFTTGSRSNKPLPSELIGVHFDRVDGIGSDSSIHDLFTSLVIGPDRKLYGSTALGQIKRWAIGPNGILSNTEVFSPPLTSSRPGENGIVETRIIIGLAFDPISTQDSLILYISHSKLIDFNSQNVDLANPLNWDGKISMLTGDSLQVLQDIVVGLPRSTKDHLTNSLSFNPSENRVMYICQGSNSGGGELDFIWKKKERLLSGAILRLEIPALPTTLPLDVRTTDNISILANAPQNSYLMTDGTYNPYADNSPLTIFASGTRNPYDGVWHSNGQLYVPTNGTAGGSYTPASDPYLGVRRPDGKLFNYLDFPYAPRTEANENQKDWLFRIVKGGYYGHPNPYRGEFVMNHGGMTYNGISGQFEDHIDVAKYPSTIGPDPNYREPVYDFGFNKSPNGIIEFKSNAFGNALKGYLMVTRFANGDDIMLLKVGPSGEIENAYTNISGLSALNDPLDIVEDPTSGNIYVSEYDRYGSNPRLTLLRAEKPSILNPELTISNKELLFEVGMSTAISSDTKSFSVKNTGNEILNFSEIRLEGSFSNQYDLIPDLSELNPGESRHIEITFAPDLGEDDFGHMDAYVVLQTNDAYRASDTIYLYGLKKEGYSGDLEPTLQNILLTVGKVAVTGWDSLYTETTPELKGEELAAPLFTKAENGPVEIIPIARYASTISEGKFGWYTRSDTSIIQEMVGIMSADSIFNIQTLYPRVNSESLSFNPGGQVFGFFSAENDQTIYSENKKGGIVRNLMRVYPAKSRNGQTLSNTFLLAVDQDNDGDYQDVVFLVSNVKPYNDGFELSFDQPALVFFSGTGTASKQATLISSSNVISGSSIKLKSSAEWIVLPDQIALNAPMSIGIDTTGFSGPFKGFISASAFGFAPDTILVEVKSLKDIAWAYQFNFHDGTVISPNAYIEDKGEPYQQRNIDGLELKFGWVLPGTTTPASALINARNRNTVGIGSVNNTFNILNHTKSLSFPPRNWIFDVPNGFYYVNIASGDPINDPNRYHILNANNKTVLIYDERIESQQIFVKQGVEIIEVKDGKIRIKAGAGSFNSCLNSIKLAPLDSSLVLKPDSLYLSFNTDSVSAIYWKDVPVFKEIVASRNSNLDSSVVNLSSSEEWLTTGDFSFNNPIPYHIDTTGMGVGKHSADIVISATGYTSDTIKVNVYIPKDFSWAYNFNFHDGSSASPPEYANDIGGKFSVKQYNGIDLNFGWVLPGIETPANASATARNRKITGVSELVNSFNILNHSNAKDFPVRDWLLEVPNGEYFVNISVGDPSNDPNRYHIVDANGKKVVTFDERNSNINEKNREGMEVIKVTDGKIRISSGLGSFITCINYANVTPLDTGLILQPDSLYLSFNGKEVDYLISEVNFKKQKVGINASSGASGMSVQLTTSEPWIILPQNVTTGKPFEIEIDTAGLDKGNYAGIVVATSPDFIADTLQVNLKVLGKIIWSKKFNFQDGSVASPLGYTDDIGQEFGIKNIGDSTLSFGWVLPHTLSPANSFANTRNRNATAYSVLTNTINIINHPNSAYPPRDWLLQMDPGYYVVNLGIGDPFLDLNRNHVVNVNDVEVARLNTQVEGANNIFVADGIKIVNAPDGLLRLTQGENGYLTSVNSFKITPLDSFFLPPTISVSFDGIYVNKQYLGTVKIFIESEDASNSGGISSLTYKLDNGMIRNFQDSLTVSDPGVHSIKVNATDQNGNQSEQELIFTIKPVSNAIILIENALKIPGSTRSFPGDDTFSFSKVNNPVNFEGTRTKMHDNGIMVIHNTGTGELLINDIVVSDIAKFSYAFREPSLNVPIKVSAGGTIELVISFTESNGTVDVREETMTILTNADNGVQTIRLLGAFQQQTEGAGEINSQQVFKTLGYKTSMNGIINPSSDYPNEQDVDNGIFGDMILSKTFVQADSTMPVRAIQVGAFHGAFQPLGILLLSLDNADTVENFYFKHGGLHFQTLFPKINASNTVPAGYAVDRISEPFKIQVEGYRSSGGGFEGSNQNQLLGIRIFKAIDRDGHVIPNEYFVLQDFVANGCGGSNSASNCDWNDNIIYFTNIRPENGLSITQIDDIAVSSDTVFSYNVKDFFDKGYAGNQLVFNAITGSSNALPDWLTIEATTGILNGRPPKTMNDSSIAIEVHAMDLNGLQRSNSFILNVVDSLSYNNRDSSSKVVSIKDELIQREIAVYPNPLKINILNIHFKNYPNSGRPLLLSISNSFGIIVLEKQISWKEDEEVSLEIPPMANGTYYVKIRMHDEEKVQKLIIIN